MAAVKELIIAGEDGTISFGDYERSEKTKKNDFEFQGSLYKVKTFADITRLEKNEAFVYESVPGTAVHGFSATADSITFEVEGPKDANITLEAEADCDYRVSVNGVEKDVIHTNVGGKLSFLAELAEKGSASVEIVKKA